MRFRTDEPVPDIEHFIAGVRRQGTKIVATNGCFDVIHAGHIWMLSHCRSYEDNCLVVVGVNDDDSVRMLKGNGRPINTIKNRLFVLDGIRHVDVAVPFSGVTAIEFLKKYRPDIWVKGADYNLHTLDKTEREFVQSYGGRIEFAPMMPDLSTTRILQKLLQ